MTNLNNEQMKQYLKTIVKLESSINQQEEIVEKAKKGLVLSLIHIFRSGSV